MKIKRIALIASLFCLLGPVEPVFADSDITSQFPDMVTAPARDNSWVVENWSGGRRRVKRFNNNSDGGSQAGFDPYQGSAQYRANAQYGGDNHQYQQANAQMPPYGRGFQSGFPSGYAPAGNGGGFGNGGFGNGGNNRSGGGFNNNNNLLPGPNDAQGGLDDPSMRKPDKFADNPDVDEKGVRHFGNGRHYDLKTMSMEQALAISAASDDQIKQDQADQRARARARNRRRDNFFP